jgi:hypothetical protein
MKTRPSLPGCRVAEFAAVALLCAVWGADAPPAPATPAPAVELPPAKEVIAKHIQAIGGREAILKQTALRAKGKLDIISQGVKGEFEVLRTKPNKQLIRIVIPDAGQIDIAFDGQVGWLTSPFTEPQLLEGKMLAQARDESDFYSALHEEQNFQSMATVAKTQFDGKECYQVKLVYKSGRQTTEYYDVKTGLQAGLQSTQESPQGAIDTTTRLADYTKFGETLQPRKITQMLGETEQVLTITSLSFDPIPEQEFAQPEPIKALVKAKEAPGK